MGFWVFQTRNLCTSNVKKEEENYGNIYSFFAFGIYAFSGHSLISTFLDHSLFNAANNAILR
jgi:hypothetical protein